MDLINNVFYGGLLFLCASGVYLADSLLKAIKGAENDGSESVSVIPLLLRSVIPLGVAIGFLHLLGVYHHVTLALRGEPFAPPWDDAILILLGCTGAGFLVQMATSLWISPHAPKFGMKVIDWLSMIAPRFDNWLLRKKLAERTRDLKRDLEASKKRHGKPLAIINVLCDDGKERKGKAELEVFEKNGVVAILYRWSRNGNSTTFSTSIDNIIDWETIK